VYITGAAESDYIQLVARTTPYGAVKDADPRKGVTLLMVPTEADGIEMTPLDIAIPETTQQYAVHFDDVAVPVENRIGAEGGGFFCLFDALNPERVTTNAISVGLGRFALRRAVDYAQERDVFDAPIGSHQGVQYPLAKAKINLELASEANMKAAKAIEDGDTDAGTHANMAKFAGSVAADEAVDASIRTHGGYGFSRDYDIITIKPLVQLLRTAPVNNNMVLNHIAENALGLPKSY
jgi:alkylation response protein AidB-like acyl-CoA dehydrogenase